LNAGKKLVVYANGLFEMPKEAKPGDVLVGELSLTSGKIEGTKLYVNFVVPPPPAPPKDDSKPKDDKAGTWEAVEKAVFDLKVEHVGKLKQTADKAKLIDELLKADPNHIGLLMARLEYLATADIKEEKDRLAKSVKILNAAEDVLKVAKVEEVLQFLGTKAPVPENDDYKKAKKDIDERKKAIAGAYYRQVETLLVEVLFGAADKKDAEKRFEQAWSKFWPFADLSDSKTVLLAAARERHYQRYGSALKLVNKFLVDQGSAAGTVASTIARLHSAWTAKTKYALPSPPTDIQELHLLRAELYHQLQWSSWARHEQQWLSGGVRFAKEYAPF
jgi:tripeptidyl-peptidase II